MDKGKGQLALRNNTAGEAYEAVLDGEVVGIVGCTATEDRRVLLGTAIEPAYRRRGIARAMIVDALDNIRVRHQTVTVACPVAAGYIRAHPKYRDTVEPVDPSRLGRRN